MTAPVLARTTSGAVRFPLAQIGGVDAVASRIWHRLRTRRGTAIEDTDRGLPWLAWRERAAIPVVEITDAVREQVVLEPGVVAVRSVTPSRVGGQITISVQVDVRAEDSIASVAIGVLDPYQTQGAPVWYAIAPVVFAP